MASGHEELCAQVRSQFTVRFAILGYTVQMDTKTKQNRRNT
jgi:hypothetical protein